jgi:hypothetical protein
VPDGEFQGAFDFRHWVSEQHAQNGRDTKRAAQKVNAFLGRKLLAFSYQLSA